LAYIPPLTRCSVAFFLIVTLGAKVENLAAAVVRDSFPRSQIGRRSANRKRPQTDRCDGKRGFLTVDTPWSALARR
jgi:hypothetical protein